MTEEEIKALKPGDKVIIKYTVGDITDAVVNLLDREEGRTVLLKCSKGTLGTADLVHPAPKFEKGDIVRVIPDPLTGYAYSDSFVLDRYVGLKGIVVEECDYHGQLEVDMGDAEENGNHLINIHCLELVEKQAGEKYYVRQYDMPDRTFNVVEEATHVTVAQYSINSHPNAKAAAKAECHRLNEEWRADQLIKINDHEF